ncbi:uncharacterized protein LOC130744912 [Lotus japonicus]|uniref:uncharacterized protein LOC130744912 n=1 Tax=Lotus japonicus TaxID=34305 RepID=UPI00258942C6|nr:uncharacterized protein LOC130744912 [Lotus japonicus]
MAEFGVTKVSHLIDHAAKSWKSALVDFIFHPTTVSHILKIPLPLNGIVDTLMWPDIVDGNYCSKSGYIFVRRKLLGACSSTSSQPSLPAPLWKKFWRTSAQPRCKEVVWRVVSSLLPVRAALRRRGMDVDPLCPVCANEEETVFHLFVSCPVAQNFWFGSPLSLRVHGFSSMEDFLADFFRAADDDALALWQAGVCALWEMRNRVVFRDGEIPVPVAAVIQRCSMLAAAPVSEVTVVPRPAPLLQATWARPPYGIYKLNFDAAVATTGEVGFGLIVRNMLGEVLASAAQYLLHAASAILGEALAFRWSMQLAIQVGFRRILFETDCLQLFQLWKKPPDGRSYLSSIVGRTVHGFLRTEANQEPNRKPNRSRTEPLRTEPNSNLN